MASEAGKSSQLPSSSSSHRLPTVSASDALHRLRNAAPQVISTGLSRLDAILSGHGAGDAASYGVSRAGGLARGQVTEIYGPPGVGKTAFGMQAAVSALHAGDKVVWIDLATPLPFPRFNDLLQAHKDSPSTSSSAKDGNYTLQELHNRFHHYTVATLAHLLALFLHPISSFPPDGTSLIVIDSVSTPFETAYHRYDDRSKKQGDAAKWAGGRKYAIMGELILNLERMAAMNSIAILLTSQTITRVRSGLGALLLPAISGQEWGNGISTQLVLFRDWPPRHTAQQDRDTEEHWKRLRYAGVIKVKGVSAEENGRFDTVVPFSIEQDGLCELTSTVTNVTVPILSSPARPSKRAFEEIADSEGEEAISEEDYGWDEEDELAVSFIKSDDLPIKQKTSTEPQTTTQTAGTSNF